MTEWVGTWCSERKCSRCYARSGLLVVAHCQPMRDGMWGALVRVTCLDRPACDARRAKRLERSRTRGSLLVLAEPKAPDAPRGTCRWCGLGLTGRNGGARSYCRLDREGRDCLGESNRSRCWDAYVALCRRGDPACVDCGREDGSWEADHDVALEDGGEHTLANLVRRCVPCHAAKTARENSERARRRRDARAGQGALL